MRRARVPLALYDTEPSVAPPTTPTLLLGAHRDRDGLRSPEKPLHGPHTVEPCGASDTHSRAADLQQAA